MWRQPLSVAMPLMERMTARLRRRLQVQFRPWLFSTSTITTTGTGHAHTRPRPWQIRIRACCGARGTNCIQPAAATTKRPCLSHSTTSLGATCRSWVKLRTCTGMHGRPRCGVGAGGASGCPATRRPASDPASLGVVGNIAVGQPGMAGDEPLFQKSCCCVMVFRNTPLADQCES